MVLTGTYKSLISLGTIRHLGAVQYHFFINTHLTQTQFIYSCHFLSREMIMSYALLELDLFLSPMPLHGSHEDVQLYILSRELANQL